MMSFGNEGKSVDVQQNLPSNGTQTNYKSNTQIPLSISTSKKGLLGDSNHQNGFQEVLRPLPSRLSFMKFDSSGDSVSPSATFHQLNKERDETSPSVHSSNGQSFRKHFKGVFTKEIDWASLMKTSKEWIKNPLNMVLLLWTICVAVSGAIIFLVMTGMLNGVIPKKSQRNEWFEINNQIINALFTLMCLYQHPKRFHHLVLLCRWKQNDIFQLQKIYCKNGTYKPNEWAHMMVVIVLLHVNCFAQYALCGLNLGYKRSERPAGGVAICLVFAIAAPAFAGLYCILSPLGRDYDMEMDEEAPDRTLTAGISHGIVESSPKWRGGLFDIWEDITLAYLSLFCTFCVFGWNMQRLGFGNMYVHIATFLLFCMAPFWIFNLAAVNIDDDTVRAALGITGVFLGLFGLLYGGFWRMKMRKKFNLPANNSCCGIPAFADCAQWLCCWWCSLAQEVRTADYYDIVEGKFCRKQMEDSVHPPMSPLYREDGLYKDHSNVNREFPRLETVISRDENLKAPVPLVIQREDYPDRKIEVLPTG